MHAAHRRRADRGAGVRYLSERLALRVNCAGLELLNKRGRRYRITLGEPVAPAGDPAELAEALRRFVTAALTRGERRFNPPDRA